MDKEISVSDRIKMHVNTIPTNTWFTWDEVATAAGVDRVRGRCVFTKLINDGKLEAKPDSGISATGKVVATYRRTGEINTLKPSYARHGDRVYPFEDFAADFYQFAFGGCPEIVRDNLNCKSINEEIE
jgi:hypothetical protein